MKLADCHILLLEDDALLGQTTVDILLDLGVASVEHVRTIEDALSELDQASYALCILDIRIGSHVCTPVANRAIAERIPILLVSGGDLRQELADLPGRQIFLRKPVSRKTWHSVLLDLAAESGD